MAGNRKDVYGLESGGLTAGSDTNLVAWVRCV
jgi:hypothetical protein